MEENKNFSEENSAEKVVPEEKKEYISRRNRKSTFRRILNSEPVLFLKDLLIIVAIVLFIRIFIAMPFQISWQSMYSSYYDKEFILVDRLTYSFRNPHRWDVIVFKPHVNENKEYFLKRIIWIPGDKVKIEWWEVYVQPKGKPDFIKLNETYLNEENKWRTFVWPDSWTRIYELKDDQYFVVWDNRNHSTDSRECFSNCSLRDEFVKKEDMLWKIFLDLWYFNFSKMRFINPGLWIETTPKFFKSESTHNYPELN